MADEIRFEAEIRGCRPPYRWKLLRVQPGVTSRVAVKRGDSEVTGEADTFESACFDAQAAALEAYDEWLQENVKEIVQVLSAPMTVPREGESDIRVAEPNRELRTIEPSSLRGQPMTHETEAQD